MTKGVIGRRSGCPTRASVLPGADGRLASRPCSGPRPTRILLLRLLALAAFVGALWTLQAVNWGPGSWTWGETVSTSKLVPSALPVQFG